MEFISQPKLTRNARFIVGGLIVMPSDHLRNVGKILDVSINDKGNVIAEIEMFDPHVNLGDTTVIDTYQKYSEFNKICYDMANELQKDKDKN